MSLIRLLVLALFFFWQLPLHGAEPKYFKNSLVDGKPQLIFRIADIRELKKELKDSENGSYDKYLEVFSDALIDVEKFYIEYIEPNFGEKIVKINEMLYAYHHFWSAVDERSAYNMMAPGFWPIVFNVALPRAALRLTDLTVVLRKFNSGPPSSFRLGIRLGERFFFGLHIPFSPLESRTIEFLTLDKKESRSLGRVPGASLMTMAVSSIVKKGSERVTIDPSALNFRQMLKDAGPLVDFSHAALSKSVRNITYPAAFLCLFMLAGITKAPVAQKMFPNKDLAKKFREENQPYLTHATPGIFVISHAVLLFLIACDKVAEVAAQNQAFQVAEKVWESEFDKIEDADLKDE